MQLWLDEINQSAATNLINVPGVYAGSNSPASKLNDRSLPLLMVGNKIDKVSTGLTDRHIEYLQNSISLNRRVAYLQPRV